MRGAVVLVGPPGSGVSTVGAALARREGLGFVDLAAVTARRLGVGEDIALVAVGEETYRGAESTEAMRALDEARKVPAVVALGSGCLADAQVREALGQLRADGGAVVALTATTRVLATRNGLDAPRSIAFGTVRHEFGLMAARREASCREVAATVVDTSTTTIDEAATQVLSHLTPPPPAEGGAS